MFRNHFTALLFVLVSQFTFMAIGQSVNLSNGFVFDGEPFLVVNPANPRHMVVSWMGYTFGQPLGIKTIATFNGGKSWSSPVIQPHFSAGFKSADPSMVFDNAGNVYCCYIDYRESPDSGGVYLTKSADGGLHWALLSRAIDAHADANKVPIDRPWLTIDPSNNHMCITTKPAPWVLPPNRPYIISSANGGQSWNPWRYIDGPGYLVGSIIKQPMAAPATSSDGKFHCIYPTYLPSQHLLPGYIHAESADNGATFTYSNVYFAASGITDTLAKAGGRLACDPALPGHMVYCFLDERSGDLDIYISESYNDGSTWSVPTRLNSDPYGNGKMQDLVWSDFSSKGDFVVAWRDRRNSSGTGYAAASEIWGTMRWHDSTNFIPNFRISDTLSSYHNILSQNGNDFMCLAVAADTLNAVWGDAGTGVLSIWFSRISLRSLHSTGVSEIVKEPVPLISIFPNPGGSLFYLDGETVSKVEVFDNAGRSVSVPGNSEPVRSVDLSGFPAGQYLLILTTRKGIVHRTVIRK